MKASFNIFTVLLMISLSWSLSAQLNHLEKKVVLDASNVSLKQVLNEMESQGHFFFSYDSELLNQDSTISFETNPAKVKTVLQAILPPTLAFKSVGRHIVIFQPQKPIDKEIVVSGYITDGRSGKPLTNATLYEPGQNIMATTDARGYFEIAVSSRAEKIGITASKQGYFQQALYVQPKQQTQVTFELLKREKELSVLHEKTLVYPNVNERALVKLIVPQRIIENTENLNLFERAKTQISFIPGIGTRGLLNGSSVNRISINVLAGYSQGTEGLEIGTLFNINTQDMVGVQLSGVGNITGRFVKGFQAASVLNYNGLLLEGVQLSGFSNINAGDLHGWQISGFSNVVNGTLKGVQLSGFSNVATGALNGVQVSGFSNVATKAFKGVQVASFSNVASQEFSGIQASAFSNVVSSVDSTIQLSGCSNVALSNFKGVQIASISNVVNQKFSGLQVSGFHNYAKEVNGVQVSGFMNQAYYNKGVQLSFFNYADSSSGLPVGFISLVKYGYHSLVVSANESFPVNVGFKTGVHRFYNIFEIGIGNEVYHASYGFGTMAPLGHKWQLSMDLTGGAIIQANNPDWEHIPFHFRFTPAINFQVSKKFGIGLGPSLNYMVSPLQAEGAFFKLSDYSFYEQNTANWYGQAWLGGRLALRVF